MTSQEKTKEIIINLSNDQLALLEYLKLKRGDDIEVIAKRLLTEMIALLTDFQHEAQIIIVPEGTKITYNEEILLIKKLKNCY